MPTPSEHLWLAGPDRASRTARLGRLDLPPALLPPLDGHRRLRGPYTVGGGIARAVVPAALDAAPDLVRAHDIELLTVAPELRDRVPASRETLTSLAVPEERTRFYSRKRTARLANGLAEFLRDWLARRPDGVSLVVEQAHLADPTDAELLAVLLRRLDPALLTLVVATDGAELPAPLGPALARHARRVDAAPVTAAGGGGAGIAEDPGEVLRLATAYVDTDGVSDVPALLAAYRSLPSEDRARLHDRRADALAESGDWSFRLGALAYHREHGSDPKGAGATALRAVLDHCIDTGFYHATIDAGLRGRALVGPDDDLPLWWLFTNKTTTAMAALGRPEEAEALYIDARARCADTTVHLHSSYATAMLYTRHHPPQRRNAAVARAAINQAIVISRLLPVAEERAFNSVFNANGLALIELHAGNLEEALRLVTEGLELLDRELDDGTHRLHRSVLRHNRAQVLSALGRYEDALQDYEAVIRQDPNYPEYHFDRAATLRLMGREAEALAAYDQALRLGPPFPEVYYNRADLRAAVGDREGALADFGYILELEPDHLDARVNRAGLLLELGRPEEAAADVEAGLAQDPDSAHLHCLRGRLELDAGRPDAARAALDRAIACDDRVAEAWATRAAAGYELGDRGGALADLDRAVALGGGPAVRFNRAVVRQELERWADAADDYGAVLDATADEPEAWLGRATCRARLGDRAGAASDVEDFLRRFPERSADVTPLLRQLRVAEPAPAVAGGV